MDSTPFTLRKHKPNYLLALVNQLEASLFLIKLNISQ